MTAPTDAHLEYSDGEFKIVDETHGNQLDVNKAEQVIETAVSEGASEVFIG
ncbi:MAG: peptidoglycan binding domain-containing protein [Eubacterium ramulus]